MRKNVSAIFLTAALLFAGTSFTNANEPSKGESPENGVITLDKSAFIQKVFDYENNQDWDYKGNKPAIVDFYADWCGPCRKLSPLLEEIQQEYNGKLQVYKVDTEKSRQLSAAFGIRSLPTIVFIPMDGEPRAVLGYVPKEQLTKMITDILKVSK
ncbi:thioredoxin [Marinilabilia rubra]|uniref:Thioredoxin n=1 Tax=Marinilabilia rubra TaxID=2162893 RepID=A0A2U2B7P6_9BACT|nr:thioredoxin [Marinilabilia rubra]PWD99090.1 thioredoxin [Marinilabilia rubra]